jgi:hypothetical protein
MESLNRSPERGKATSKKRNILLLLIAFSMGLNSPGGNVFSLKTIFNRPTAYEQQHGATPYG